MFLLLNDTEILETDEEAYSQILIRAFPQHTWESNQNIEGGHPLFLYNLATVVGDRHRWGTNDFSELKEKVATVFSKIYRTT